MEDVTSGTKLQAHPDHSLSVLHNRLAQGGGGSFFRLLNEWDLKISLALYMAFMIANNLMRCCSPISNKKLGRIFFFVYQSLNVNLNV